MITAGEILKTKRESLEKSLDLASQETRIQKRFLKYIEKNEFEKFDSEVFLTGFLKIYSKYLNIDTEKILALYRRAKPLKTPKKKTEKKRFTSPKLPLTPKLLVTISLSIFLVAILGYIGFQIYKFQSPPKLEISYPPEDFQTEQQLLEVTGTSLPNTMISINDSPLETDTDGKFKKEITLNEGINIVTVKARKNNNNILESVVTRKITYHGDIKPAEVVEPVKQTNKLTIEVTGTAAWIKLDIDSENKLSQILQPSKKEYVLGETFSVITGKVNNTNIYFNDQPLAWKKNTTTGVAEISCKVINSQLDCE